MLIDRGGPSALLACLVLSISACGGGGGGGGGGGFPVAGLGPGAGVPTSTGGPNPSDLSSAGDDAIAVTFDGSLDGFFIASSNYPQPTPVLIKAKLSRDPVGTVYPVIVDSQQVLSTQWGGFTVTKGPDGAYSGYLTPKAGMAPGVYSGKLQLRLCKDPACAAEYKLTGGEFPYKLEYAADVTLTAKLNGTPVKDIRGMTSVSSGKTMQFVALDGAVVQVESNIPVTWTVTSSGTTKSLAVATQTDKLVSGTVMTGSMSGSIEVKAQPVDTRYKYIATVSLLPQ